MNNIRPFFLASTPFQRLIMYASVCGNLAVILFCLRYVLANYEMIRPGLIVSTAAILLGYFVADFASGAVHWGMDTWFSERAFGRAIAIAREHHTHPQHILGYGFLEHCTLGSAPSAVFIGLGSLITAFFPVSIVTYGFMVIFLITATCLFFGTSFHNLAHKQSSSALLRAAQRMRLIISPEHHWTHHRSAQVVRYCVINGWANYPCDRLHIWRGLEWLVQKTTGAEPRKDDLEWQRHYRETGTLVSANPN
jgi:ubiquitin-conjugating enzyme E2 variant